MDFVKQAFRGVDPEKLEKAIAVSEKRVAAPKTTTRECANAGAYNALGLLQPAHHIVKVTDQSKAKMETRVVGQSVVATRNFKPPVTVEFVTLADYEKWQQEIINDVRRQVD